VRENFFVAQWPPLGVSKRSFPQGFSIPLFWELRSPDSSLIPGLRDVRHPKYASPPVLENVRMYAPVRMYFGPVSVQRFAWQTVTYDASSLEWRCKLPDQFFRNALRFFHNFVAQIFFRGESAPPELVFYVRPYLLDWIKICTFRWPLEGIDKVVQVQAMFLVGWCDVLLEIVPLMAKIMVIYIFVVTTVSDDEWHGFFFRRTDLANPGYPGFLGRSFRQLRVSVG
jgi:hypothetical protein